MSDFRYRADVDGLRAVAVLLVLLFHAGFGFTGGFVGVDVFFVISGFLITSLILSEQQADKFQLANFWGRRIRRIVPAATVMVVTLLIAGGFLLLPADYEKVGESTISQQLMLSNFYFWRHTGYFDGQMDLNPLLHTWSLAVEEQFYLVYPLLFIFLRRFSQRWAIVVLLGLGASSLAISQWGIELHQRAMFYLLPSRAWELLIGGLICFVPAPTRLRGWHLSLLSWLAIGGILFAGWFYSPSTRFPGLLALVPCGAAATLIYANSAGLTGIGRALAAKPVVFVGLISYSLYLWHWPILTLLRYWQGGEIDVSIRVLVVVASFGLAYLSWRFVETPFRKTKREASISWPYFAALAAGVSVAGLSLAIVFSHGLRARFPESVLDVVEGSEVPTKYQTSLEEAQRGEFPKIGINKPSSKDVDFIIWGDSHGMALVPLAHQLACKYQLSGEVAVYAGTVPLLDVWRPAEGRQGESKRIWNQYVFDHVMEKGISNVFLASRWAVNILGRPTGQMDTLIVDDESKDANPNESRIAFARTLNKTIGALEQRGLHVDFLGQVPTQVGNPPKKLFYAAWWGRDVPKGVPLEVYKKRQATVMLSLSELRANYTFLDPTRYCFDETGYSKLGDGTKSFYCDDNHLSPYGAQVLLTDLIDPVFAEMATGKLAPRKIQGRSVVYKHDSSR